MFQGATKFRSLYFMFLVEQFASLCNGVATTEGTGFWTPDNDLNSSGIVPSFHTFG